jgi:hypothetical protein
MCIVEGSNLGFPSHLCEFAQWRWRGAWAGKRRRGGGEEEAQPKGGGRGDLVSRKSSYAQFHLELGQPNFLLHTCSVCSMMYGRGNDNDEKVHGGGGGGLLLLLGTGAIWRHLAGHRALGTWRPGQVALLCCCRIALRWHGESASELDASRAAHQAELWRLAPAETGDDNEAVSRDRW